MDQKWVRLGAALSTARTQHVPRLTQKDVAASLGTALSTVQNIERGAGSKGATLARVSSTMRAYAELVGWTPDSIDAVLAGGKPTYREPAGEGRAAVPEAGLPLRIVHELERPGELVDTAVIPLTDDADMVVVVKGRQTATREQLLAALEVWRQTEPQLQLQDRDDEEPAGA